VDESAYGFLIDPTCGLITGTPTQTGTYQFTVIVTDAFLNTSTPVTFTWKVTGGGLSFTAPGNQTNAVGDKVNLAMSGASGGTAPYTWSASGLPAGLSMNASTGVVSGTITAGSATPATVTVTLSDSAKTTPVTQTFTWTVPVAGPSISAPTVPASTVGTKVSTTASYTCASTPCTFTLQNAPSWLTITSTSGSAITLGGTPDKTGSNGGITITVKDSKGKTAISSAFAWPVSAAPTPPSINFSNSPTPTKSGSSRTGYTYTFTPQSQSCSAGGCTYSVTATEYQSSRWGGGSWVPVSGFNVGSSGNVTVSNPGSGQYQITVTIKDKNGATDSDTFTWTLS
jgi:hypothetical protein